MDLEIIILSEVSQTEKDKYYISLMYRIKNAIQMNLVAKENKHGYQRGNAGGINEEYGLSRYTLLNIK